MTRLAIALGTALYLAGGGPSASLAFAAKGKPAAAKGEAPTASAEEINKLKGDYKWGLSSDEVATKIEDNVRASYDDRLKKTINDPSKQDRVRKEMAAELEKVKGKLIKFDGQKTGYDVSIIDQEFVHSVGESMLVAKEEQSTRYFFFKDDRLYKMFIAFDKEMLQGKSFREFGQLMQKRFGKAREVNVEERTKAGVKTTLDHFIWSSKSGDMLRLVDRSDFYDVYCLVIYDGNIARQQDEIRRAQAKGPERDNLVEAVTNRSPNERDPNDNIVDEITGKKPLKPGETRGETITVPSVNVHAPTPAEVNRKEAPADGEKSGSKSKDKTKGLPL